MTQDSEIIQTQARREMLSKELGKAGEKGKPSQEKKSWKVDMNWDKPCIIEFPQNQQDKLLEKQQNSGIRGEWYSDKRFIKWYSEKRFIKCLALFKAPAVTILVITGSLWIRN